MLLCDFLSLLGMLIEPITNNSNDVTNGLFS